MNFVQEQLNSPSHHKYVPKTVCESLTWRLASLRALRELNARWALPVHPILRTKS